MEKYKKMPLEASDIKTLKYQFRPGILFPLMLLVPGVVVVRVISNMNPELLLLTGIDFTWFLMVVVIGLAALMHFTMTRNYRADIKNKVKNVVLKPIQRLEEKTDFEAGSGTLYVGQEMNAHKVFYVIVDNVRHRIDKELYNMLETGGEVAFHYAPVSNYLIKIDRPE
ncbi:MAG TPA: hypothetical protein VJ937_07040 [Salinivirga sp.]|uniref:hypothetical protein n=1 Tax=Salinivirga sp. TaxID=1970192 RepID=UPI002B473EE7|nr:hypothetical protein [Salinivirga sp.]HKK59215.1 hypothetical protein [Salinivirga sp.]